MPRGLSASQIGVTEAMIATYGSLIWEHSNNVQVRHGDPVRTLDFPLARQQRSLTDQEIAALLGLTRDQVLQIRVMLEVRNYDRRHYSRLHQLGGNRRFRSESEIEHAGQTITPKRSLYGACFATMRLWCANILKQVGGPMIR